MNIVMLLNRNFTRLVVLSIVIALPVSVLVVNFWLNEFAYKTPVEIWWYAASAFSALVLAWASVSYHSLKASLINPAETITYE